MAGLAARGRHVLVIRRQGVLVLELARSIGRRTDAGKLEEKRGSIRDRLSPQVLAGRT